MYRRTTVLLAALQVVSGCDAPQAEESPAPDMSEASAPAEPAHSLRLVDGEIHTDTFDVRHDFRDGRLTLVLDSDLSDETKLMVSVTRTYQQIGNDEDYSIAYFSESGTIGDWREPRTLHLTPSEWDRRLEEQQRIMASAGEPFTVESIFDSIEISFTVPVNQDPPFESLNANLVGSVVSESGNLRVVRSEIPVFWPTDSEGSDLPAYADPVNLVAGRQYTGSERIPVMPEMDPEDPVAALNRVRDLQPGASFEIVERIEQSGLPWYRVTVDGSEGWINSAALIGQDITEVP